MSSDGSFRDFCQRFYSNCDFKVFFLITTVKRFIFTGESCISKKVF